VIACFGDDGERSLFDVGRMKCDRLFGYDGRAIAF